MQTIKARYKMKIALGLFIFLGCSFHSFCQQHHFILKVHFDNPSVKTLGIGEAYYYKFKPYYVAKIKPDSSNANNKTYLFEGTILYPTAVRLYPTNNIKMNKLIFIDTGYQEISIVKKDSFYIVKSNTAIEQKLKKFLNEMNIKTIDAKIDGEKLLSYVQNNPDSYIALFAIINQAFRYPYPVIFEKINDAFGKKIKQTKAFQYYLSLYSPNTIGVDASDFLAKSIDGKEVRLSSFRNKKFVLLDFWASWCGPCLEMVPHLKNLYQKYHSKGLEIISISVDTDTTAWQKAVRKEKLDSWINVISTDYGRKSSHLPGIDTKYSITEYPTTVLIDKEGKIIGRYVGYEEDGSKSDLDKKLSEVFR